VLTQNYVTAAITNGFATTNYVKAATNGFVTATITNGLATTNFVLTQNYVTAAITNGFATTNYVKTATNGFVTATITNGLATTNFVLSQNYVTAAITNGFATTNYVKTATNGFVTATITNGLATTNYVQAVTNALRITPYGTVLHPIALNQKYTNGNFRASLTIEYFQASGANPAVNGGAGLYTNFNSGEGFNTFNPAANATNTQFATFFLSPNDVVLVTNISTGTGVFSVTNSVAKTQ
jgi:hypothetical protein